MKTLGFGLGIAFLILAVAGAFVDGAIIGLSRGGAYVIGTALVLALFNDSIRESMGKFIVAGLVVMGLAVLISFYQKEIALLLVLVGLGALAYKWFTRKKPHHPQTQVNVQINNHPPYH